MRPSSTSCSAGTRCPTRSVPPATHDRCPTTRDDEMTGRLHRGAEVSSASAPERAVLIASPGPTVTALCWAGSLLLIASGLIHLHLWATGYRHISTIGPLFLLQGIAGIALALVVAVSRQLLAMVAGALFALGTMAG